MNGQDRRFIDRLDAVVKEIGTLNPANPCDMKAISANLRIATTAAKELSAAIGALRGQDWVSVDVHLSAAERITAR
jgi:hypothetical protein